MLLCMGGVLQAQETCKSGVICKTGANGAPTCAGATSDADATTAKETTDAGTVADVKPLPDIASVTDVAASPDKISEEDSATCPDGVGENCGDTGQCVGDACPTCEIGTHRCADGKRETCDPTASWQVEACPVAKPFCDDGNCVVCLANKTFCNVPPKGQTKTLEVLQCNKTGTDYDLADTCVAPLACYSGACRLCMPGAKQCKSLNIIETCADDGQSWVPKPCAKATPICSSDTCLACDPNQLFCGAPEADGGTSKVVLKCNALGSKGDVTKVCADGEVCAGGQCGVCPSNASTCLGPLGLLCAADGKSWKVVADCASKNVPCLNGACGCNAGNATCAAPPAGLAVSVAFAVCDAGGDSASSVSSCKLGENCDAGTCQTCIPDALRCQDGKALKCPADGTGWFVVENCNDSDSVCAVGKCVDVCALAGGNPTSRGCSFWAADLDNVGGPGMDKNQDAQNAPFGVLIANGNSKTANITVTLGPIVNGVPKKTYATQVGAKSAITLELPVPEWGLTPNTVDGTSQGIQAFHLVSDKAITITQLNPLNPSPAPSTDSSLLLPANAWGLNHRIVGRPQTVLDQHGFIAVIASDPLPTTVTFTVTAPTLAGGAIAAHKAGDTFKVKMVAGETLQLETDGIGADLTGSLVEADRPIAVFSGAEAAHAPDTTHCIFAPKTPVGVAGACYGTGKICFVDSDCAQICCADHLEEQIPPIANWGAVHAVPYLQPRGAKDAALVRVVASTNGTTVVTVPAQGPPVTLKAGDFVEYIVSVDLLVLATHPVLVAQMMTSSQLVMEGGGDQGDPLLLIIPPVSRFGGEVVFTVPSTFANNYINIAAGPGAVITLDGGAVAMEAGVPGHPWQFARKSVGAGVHTLNGNAPFGATSYGWSKGASYGHSLAFGSP